MKIFFKIISLALVISVLCSILSSCDNKSSDDDKVVLNIWHQWANETTELKKLYDKAVKEYEKENPNIKINTYTYTTEAYKTKITTEFAGSADSIDVFYWWGAGTAEKFVDSDKLLALDEYLSDDVKSRIIPGSTASFEFDGKLYSVPMFSWYMTLFCNQELFDKAGAELPQNYSQLVEAVKKLNKLDGVTPIASGANDEWNAAFIYQAMALRCVGAENINKMASGKLGFDDSGYRDAAQRVTELYNLGAFGDSPRAYGSDDANYEFITGKAAMRIMGSWFANQVYSDVNCTIDPSKVVAMKIPVIYEDKNPQDYCGGFVESFWVNKSTNYPKEAAEFCLYINERLGVLAYESGSGLSGWNTEADESNLNPLFVQIKEFQNQSVSGVLAWDTLFNSEFASMHNRMTQSLLSPDADIDNFINEHKALLNKE